MGKHDSDESMGFFLGGAEKVKDGSLWLLKNLKILLMIALIPAIGFGAYYLTKFIMNKKPNTEPTYAVVPGTTKDREEEKEYIGGYEVLGEIKASKVGVDVKVLNPTLDGVEYVEDSLKYGAIFYFGEGINEIGNTVILGHNSSSSFYGLKDLEINDQFSVLDSKGNTTNYTVIEKTTCEPDDFSKFLPMEEKSTEITLITCETEGTQRLVIKAISK